MVDAKEFWFQPLGDDAIGKETFMKRSMLGYSFSLCQEYDPADDFSFTNQFQFDTMKVKISCVNKYDFIQFGSKEKRQSINDGFSIKALEDIINQSHAFIFMYSKAQKSTFQSIEEFWYPQIVKYGKEACPLILLATNGDKEGQIQVSKHEGQQLANKLNMTFMEMSMMTANNEQLQNVWKVAYKQLTQPNTKTDSDSCCNIL